jgi:acyl transferase domain-containing protein/acyl carrier protein
MNDEKVSGRTDIAIVGMACRFPDAGNYDQYWDNLWRGINSITEISKERWDVGKYYSSDINEPNKTISKYCGQLDHIDQFDNRFFNISPREANNMDPQQRLLLEETWHCIEDSGISLDTLQQKRTAVYIGVMTADYRQEALAPGVETDSYACLGNYECILANRISYVFGLQGSSISINAACASSLVAISEAKRSLAQGKSDYVIVGGVSLNIHPWKYISFSKSRMLSPDGQCKTFDKDANGYVPGEGVGVLLLQRLSDAIRDGNHIYGIIKGSGVKHGGKALSITAPRVEAQRDVILEAYEDAGLSPDTVSYVEAHGTGTSLGDPVEVESLTQAFRKYSQRTQFCKIGSVKTNIGHLEAAAGIAGVIKVLLMMRHKKIPPTLNIKTLNPIIDFENSPFMVATGLTDWVSREEGIPLRAGVSSFGFGGVNSHVLLEEFIPKDTTREGAFESSHLFILSAKTPESLEKLLDEWRLFSNGQNFSDGKIRALCLTLLTGRETTFPYRFGRIISHHEELKEVLKAAGTDATPKSTPQSWSLLIGDLPGCNGHDIQPLLKGLGIFKQNLDRVTQCLKALNPNQNWLKGFPQTNGKDSERALYSFVIGFAYLATLIDLGFTPDLIAGEKSGLRIGLVVSGIMKLEDVLGVLCKKKEWKDLSLQRPVIPFHDPVTGRTIMPYHYDEAYLSLLTTGLKVDQEVLAYYVAKARLLSTSQFTFNKYLDEWDVILKQFGSDVTKMLADEELGSPQTDRLPSEQLLLLIIITSSLRRLSQKWDLTEQKLVDDQRFYELLDLVVDEALPKEALVELFIKNGVSLAAVAQTLNERQKRMNPANPYPYIKKCSQSIAEIKNVPVWIKEALSTEKTVAFNDHSPLLRFGTIGSNSVSTKVVSVETTGISEVAFKEALLDLWSQGVNIRWEKLYQESAFEKLSLPVYPFNRDSFWLFDKSKQSEIPMADPKDGPADRQINQTGVTHSSGKVPVRMYFQSEWDRSEPGPSENIPELSGDILIFDLDSRLRNRIIDQLKKSRETKSQVVLVKPGERFRSLRDRIFEVRPGNPADYQQLIATLALQNLMPDKIIHLWSRDGFHGNEKTLSIQLEKGIYSVFYLTQALMEQKPKNRIQMVYTFFSDQGKPQPHYAAVGGFAKTIQLENPKFNYKTVEIRTATVKTITEPAQLLGILAREFDGREGEIRYEDGQRLIKKLREIDLESRVAQPALLKDQGVYLITGGLGGLGLMMAKYIAKRVKARLVLVGRSDLNPVKEAKIKELETLGSEVIFIKADMSVSDDVRKVITKTKSQFEKIDGVFHLAGVIRHAFFIKKTPEEIKAVLAPKVYSTVFLDEATKNEKLDFLIMFSSIVAVTGNVGLADYAYGNSFMDHFTEMRENLRVRGERSGMTLAINWPLWKDGGMQISGEESRIFFEQTGLEALPNHEGIKFLDTVLPQTDIGQCLVCYGDPDRVRQFLNQPPASREIAANGEMIVDQALLFDKTEKFLKTIIAGEINLPVDQLGSEVRFEEYGIDSILIHHFNAKITQELGPTSKTLLFENQTIRELTDYFIKSHGPELAKLFQLEKNENTMVMAENRETLPGVTPGERDRDQGKGPGYGEGPPPGDEGIAIVGVSGRYPFAKDLEEFWENLKSGRDCISQIPESRWSLKDYYDPDPENSNHGKMYCKWGGFLEDADKFDPLFFNISPREIETTDPQERLFLETAWATLEDAGYTRKKLKEYISKEKDANVGVFVGVTTNTYQLLGPEEWLKGNHVIPTAMPWSVANRVSYLFNFHGPSMSVDTACASSLSAVHLACESIRKRECRVAIAGGVNLYLHPLKYVWLCKMRMLSATGKCHSFGAGADGFTPGEGVGAILLKPLSEAIRDRDHIYAVIKSSSTNHGGRTNGYTVPDPNAHAKLILQSLANANLNSRTITCIEAHGTGTLLGDPIEITGLTKAFKEDTGDTQFCSIGSVKSNIGHLESAAGIAGLTKLLLQMKYKKIAPSLHSQALNPNIDFHGSPFYVPQELTQWRQPTLIEHGEAKTYPRRAGISSFGAGGVNVHVILEENETPEMQSGEARGPFLIVLSAKNGERLKVHAENLCRYLKKVSASGVEETQTISLEDIAYTLQVGREGLEERLAMVVTGPDELLQGLTKYGQGNTAIDNFYHRNIKANQGDSGLLFEGKEAEEFLKVVVAERRFYKLAQLWVSGAEIDWRLLYQDRAPRRVSLPTYPFARERYWITGSDNQVQFTDHKNGPAAKLHPLIDANRSNFREERFTTQLTGNEFYLVKQTASNRKMFPGVAFLEMACAAGAIAGENRVQSLKNIVWAKPVFCDENRCEIEISLYPGGDSAEYEVRTNHRTVHTRGKLFYQDHSVKPSGNEVLDLEAIKRRFPILEKSNQFYQALPKSALPSHTGFQVIQELYSNESESLSLLVLPTALQEGFGEFILHPVLMDGVLQTVIRLMTQVDQDPNLLYLPFSLSELTMIKPLPERCFAYVTGFDGREAAAGVKKFNIQLLDETGRVLVSLKEFSCKAFPGSRFLPAPAQDGPVMMYFGNKWEKSELDPKTLNHQAGLGQVLIFDTDEKLFNTFKDDFKHQAVTLVKPGVEYQSLENRIYEINPEKPEDYLTLIKELKKKNRLPDKLVHLWSVQNQLIDTDQGQNLISGRDLNPINRALLVKGIYSVFYLVKALSTVKVHSLTRFMFIYNREKQAPNPLLEAVAGYSGSLKLVFPNLSFSTVEVLAPGRNVKDLAAIIHQELNAPEKNPAHEIQYDGEERYLKKVVPLELKANGNVILKKQGVYLITGGAGGLGLIFARHLAGNYQAKLILTGRSVLDRSKENLFQELRDLGAEVTYLQANVADLADMKNVIGTIRQKYGSLHGVIHAAGYIGQTLIGQKDPDEFEATLKPKIQGTIMLDEVTQSEPLDFLVMFSSASAILGDFGQCDYAVANRFMDGFASLGEVWRAKNERNGKMITINWPLWKNGGMHLGTDGEVLYLQSSGMTYLETENGLKAFDTILGSGNSQVMVMMGHQKRVTRFLGLGSEAGDSTFKTQPFKVQMEKAGPGTPATGLGEVALERRVELDLRQTVSKLIKIESDRIDSGENLGNLGFDSLSLKELADILSKNYQVTVSPAVFFAHSNLKSLSQYLISEFEKELKQYYAGPGVQPGSMPEARPEYQEFPDFESLEPRFDQVAKTRFNSIRPYEGVQKTVVKEPVAIIGISGIFPGSRDLTEFWDNLEQEKDLITEIPKERWDWREYYSESNDSKHKTNSKWGGFIGDADKFDAKFFSISPREAELMDPQHRLFLETVWKTMEDAGYKASSFSGKNMGVFVGIQFSDYQQLLENMGEVQTQVATGNAHAMIGNRVSYFLNLKGPSESIDTACSSSLVAVHRAVKAIQNGECETAIVGGASLMLSPYTFLGAGKLGVLSPDGRCKTFDKLANGYVKGEGVGALLIKPLSQAIKDHDYIYGVIKGTAENHGGKANSLTAPNSQSQAALLVCAYQEAEMDPQSVTYIEAHGTGTQLGDPVEIEGLKKAFRDLSQMCNRSGPKTAYCGIGSVKTNIGHLEPAAGMAGIIKVLLAMKHQKLPGTPHFKELNPYINLRDTPFYVVAKTKTWEQLRDESGNPLPRRAGVSSFGFGGVNAHTVLEEYDNFSLQPANPNVSDQMVVISAKNEERLQAYVRDLADYLEKRVVGRVEEDGDEARILRDLEQELLKIVAEMTDFHEKDIAFDSDLYDYGFDPVTYAALTRKINKKFGLRIQPSVFTEHGSLDSFTRHLFQRNKDYFYGRYGMKSTDKEKTTTAVSANVFLEDIAYTLQVGREEMEERLALVVRSKEELIDKLKKYLAGDPAIDNLKSGNVKRNPGNISFDPDDTQEFIDLYLKKGKLSKLAELWVKGIAIDWSLLPRNKECRRVPLPTYPFSRERYWLPGGGNSPVEMNQRTKFTKLHALLDSNESTLDEFCFKKVFTGEEFFLTDHMNMLPAVVYMEMVRAAGNLASKNSGIKRLKNIVWANPIIVRETPQEVLVGFYPDGELVEFEVSSIGTGNQRVLHAQGKLVCDNDLLEAAPPEFLDINSIKKRCEGGKGLAEAYYQHLISLGAHLGPRFMGIQEFYYNQTEALSAVGIPPELEDGVSAFLLHPTLTDGGIQTVVAWAYQTILGPENIYLPFVLGELEIINPSLRISYAYVRMAENQRLEEPQAIKYHVLLLNDAGQVVAKLKNLSIRASRLGLNNPIPDQPESSVIYYDNVWEKSDFDHIATLERVPGIILIFDPGGKMDGPFQTGLYQAGYQVVLVKPGAAFQEVEPMIYQLNPGHQEDYQKLVASLEHRQIMPTTILHMWSQEDFTGNEESLISQLNKGIYSLFYVTKALLEKSFQTKTSILYLYFTEVKVQPQYMAVSGFAKTVQLENPNFMVKTIGIQASPKPQTVWDDPRLWPIISNELRAAAEDEIEIRYENGLRFVKHLKECELDNEGNNPVSLREKGVYLITGGVGGLGLIFAEYLAKRTKAKLVLTDRADLNAEQKRRIRELEDLGSEIMYVKSDISKQGDVNKVVSQAKSRFKAINGVIHCAGVIRDSVILKKTRSEMDTVFAPKVFGTMFLDEALREEKLDFMVLFSSSTAVLGNAGQSDYAYANRFMDYFAAMRNQEKRPGKTLAINWTLWKDGGMRISEQTEKLIFNTGGIKALTKEAGLNVFEKGLSLSQNQLLVLAGDRHKISRTLGLGERNSRQLETGQVKAVVEADRESLLPEYQKDLLQMIAGILKIGATEINWDANMSEFGFDSISFTELANEINKKYDLEITPAIFFGHSSPGSIGLYLGREHGDRIFRYYQNRLKVETRETDALEEKSGLNEGSNSRSVFKSGKRIGARVENPEVKSQEPVAIVGINGVMPKSPDLESFWRHLENGDDLIEEIPLERWDWRSYYGDPMTEPDKTNIKWGGFMQEVDKFDPLFFSISPREAELMDPQERILLETVWKTIEDAGYKPADLSDTKTGLFLGVSNADYQELLIENHIAAALTHSLLVNRISYLLNLRGPSEPVDTACSSSLVAIHRAVEAIQLGNCEMALAGGVNVIVCPNLYIFESKSGMLSVDGRCKTFDKSANGYVRGEGAGVILLKPLSKAIADRDHIYAVIKATAVNHGGHGSSLTAPNSNAQAELLISAYEKSRLDPATVNYIEAHGTGTSLGDPVEIEGLKQAFKELYRKWGKSVPNQPLCGVGSVKTNIGHLESASGIAGVLKVLLAMKHKKIPANVHFKELNPYIRLNDSPFFIVNEVRDWENLQDETGQPIPRRAGVSSFGIGGVNAHVVLEEYLSPVMSPAAQNQAGQILALSAKNEERLKSYAGEMIKLLKGSTPGQDCSLEEIAYTLQIGREAMEERLAIVASSFEELIDKLTGYSQGKTEIENVFHGNLKTGLAKSGLPTGGQTGGEWAGNMIGIQELNRIAQLWVSGKEVAWKLLYPEYIPRRVSLPTYPFARERYWIPESQNGFKVEARRLAKLHPLIDANTSNLSEQKFTTVFTGQEYYLKDHVVFGAKILPGAFYLEMACAAGEMAGEHKVRKIKNVIWAQPITVTDQPVTVDIRLYPVGESVEFEISATGENNQRAVHSQGKVYYETPGALSPVVDLVDIEAIKKRCGDSRTGPECYQEFQEKGLQLGPCFHSVREIFNNSTECLAYLELPVLLQSGFQDYTLHPALIDGALQAVSGLLGNEGNHPQDLYLPLALGEIEIIKVLPEKCYAYVTSVANQTTGSNIKKFNIQLLGETGQVLVRVNGFSVKTVYRRPGNDQELLDIFRGLERGELDIDAVEQLIGA